MSAPSLNDAYRHCQQLAQRHYENFPVASRLLPRRIRRAVAVIYAFARTADDIADEGDAGTETRLAELDRYAESLDRIAGGEETDDPIFTALADVISHHQLPLSLFHDLLSAFRQDVTKKRYRDFSEVLDYCRRSANPVGRLLLHLNGAADRANLAASDHICSALQLINFLQDLQQDYQENGRIYLPQDEMQRFGVEESHLAAAISDERMQQLIDFQLKRIELMLAEGAVLGERLKGRFGLEIRLIIAAGIKVTERLMAHGGEVYARPRLRPSDYLQILLQGLFFRTRIISRRAPFGSSGNG
jgi:squalene synthase HpnC